MKKLIMVMIAVMVLTASCEQFEQGGISLHYTWKDSDGNDITPPDMNLLFAWAEVEYSGEKKETGPVWMGEDGSILRFDNLPYDRTMQLTLTIRMTEDETVAEDKLPSEPEVRTDNIAYYCTSQEFKLKRGKVTVIENGCVMEEGPALSDGSKPGSPELSVYYRNKAEEEIEVTAETEMKTPVNKVDIVFKAPNDNFDTIIIANDTGFAVGKQELAKPAKGTDGRYTITDFDLNEGLSATTDGSRTVALKLKNTLGFESKQTAETIFLDTTAPFLTVKSDAPAYNNSGTVTVTVSSNEQLKDKPAMAIYDKDGKKIRDMTEEAEELQKGMSYRYQIAVSGNLEDGEYFIKTSGSDIIENAAAEIDSDLFSVDSLLPELDGSAVITPGRVRQEQEFAVTFTVMEEMSEGIVKVSRKEEELTCTNEGKNYSCKGTAPAGTGDTLDPVTIALTDKAGNLNTYNAGTLYVDRTAPVLTAQIVPGDKTLNAAELLQITINASEDLSGSPAVQLLDSGSNVTVPLNTEKQGLSYIYSYPVLSDGSYSFTADGTDTAGHNATQVSITGIMSDSSVPEVTGVVTVIPERIRPGVTSTVTFTASEKMNDAGDTVEVKVGSGTASCNTADGLSYTCTYLGSGTGSDSIETISITLTDSSANTTTSQHGTLYVDRTAPV
ncbi:MAG TPA: hypothetical protein PKG52_05415, partial [bacterium]|nr:hypothetical protein [bacterium]